MSKIENKILSEWVYEKIKLMIDEGDIKPGEKVNKHALAEQLSASQTPINDALSRLAGEKFLDQRSRQGFFIRQYSDFELSQLFELRASIEGMAARLCVEQATDDEIDQLAHVFDGFAIPFSEKSVLDYLHVDKIFHEKLVNYSRNPFLSDTVKTTGYLIKSNQKGLLRPPEETLPEHLDIIDALQKRDSVRAQELTILHLLKTRGKLRQKS